MRVIASLRARILALVLAAGAAAGVTTFLALGSVIDTQLDASVDTGLQARATDIARSLNLGATTAVQADPFAQVLGPAGAVLSRSTRAPSQAVLDAAQLEQVRRGAISAEVPIAELGGPARVRAIESPQGVVVVATGLGDVAEFRDRVDALLLATLALLVGAIAGGSWMLVGATLRPVARMSRAAAAMGGSDAHLRLPQPTGRDEIALLGSTLNDLLDRIEEFVARERQFLDDASHEFRTPLTVLRGELELAADEPDSDRVRQGVRVALHEAERLSALADDLLVLARQRSTAQSPHRDTVDLTAWVKESVATLRQSFRGLPEVVVTGTPGLAAHIDVSSMHRVLINLMNNAAAAGADNLLITIHSEETASHHDEWSRAVVDVDDDGPGFPEEFLPRAFERFATADRARSRRDADGGTGLGLPIVAAVLAAHRGDCAATNDSALGGARIRLLLPLP